MKSELDKDLENEELDLFAQRLCIDEIPVPAELEDKIRARIRKVRRYPYMLLRVCSLSAAIFILFVGGIKTSPALAGYMTNIPLIGNAVQWLQGDSGIRKASENGYKNLGPVVLSKDGITLTLDNIYFDEDRLRMSAVAEGKAIEQKDYSQSATAQVEINAADGKPVRAGKDADPEPAGTSPMIMVTFIDFAEPGGSAESRGFNGEKMEILAEKTFKPGEVADFLKKLKIQELRLNVKVYKQNEWNVDFGTVVIPFNTKDILMSKTYPQQGKIRIEHGVVNIDMLTASPTRIRMDVSFDMDPGYFFTGFENPELWDGNGNIYKPEGLVSSNWDEKTRSIYMVPSIYFDSLPEKLYLSFSGIRIGAEEGRTFEIRMGESFPRKLDYMGHEVTIEKAEYREGQLEVSCRLADNRLLNINGLELSGDNLGQSTLYSESSGSSNGNTNWFKSIFKVGKRDSYKLKFEYPGYLVNTPVKSELKLKKKE